MLCRTFDNVTYPYTMHNCWTLVSAHCSPVPSYAVFMRKSSKFATDIVPKMEVEVRKYLLNVFYHHLRSVKNLFDFIHIKYTENI
jgi:hypothetical protein